MLLMKSHSWSFSTNRQKMLKIRRDGTKQKKKEICEKLWEAKVKLQKEEEIEGLLSINLFTQTRNQ
jgi:hypothetical protein